MRSIKYGFSLLLLLSACKKDSKEPSDPFEDAPVSVPVMPALNEISGIADSKLNPGYLWGEEDSGSPSMIRLLGHDGKVVKNIFLKGISNRDWEDMCLTGGQLFIAETGDNSLAFPDYAIYKFPEPSLAADTVNNIQTIRFTYPDGSHDAEAFLVDPLTQDIFLITKRDNPSKVFRIAYPYGPSNQAVLSGTVNITGVVSAAISEDGTEIMLKTYPEIFYYKRAQGQSIFQALGNSPLSIKYAAEPQGEALSFAIDHSGFFTLSEKAFANYVNLNFYKRK